MNWEEYAKDLLIFQVKAFSLPIEDVTKIKINEFKDEFRELKKWLSKIEWDAEAHVENYYDDSRNQNVYGFMSYFVKRVSLGENIIPKK